MELAVVGSRTFDNYELLKEKLDKIHERKKITAIVSGGARGADTLAEKWANEYKIPKIIFVPDWNKHGRKAGYLRNVQIIEYAQSVVAFWDGESKGTLHSINLAKKYGKPCLIVKF